MGRVRKTLDLQEHRVWLPGHPLVEQVLGVKRTGTDNEDDVIGPQRCLLQEGIRQDWGPRGRRRAALGWETGTYKVWVHLWEVHTPTWDRAP